MTQETCEQQKVVGGSALSFSVCFLSAVQIGWFPLFVFTFPDPFLCSLCLAVKPML